MAKFCKKCGTALSPDIKFCPQCGTIITRPSQAEATTPINEETSTTSTSKKKTKLPVILVTATALLLVLTIILGTATACTLFLFRDKEFIRAGNDLVFENRYGTFCPAGGYLVNITANNGEGACSDREYNAVSFYPDRGVCDKNTIFYLCMDGDIIKAEIDGETTRSEEFWMTPEDFFDTTEKEFLGIFPGATLNWQYQDGYIYFITSHEMRNYEGRRDSTSILARINTKTKDIELIDENIAPISYVVSGKWIYFSESGYNRDDNDYDLDKAGIYKIRTNGTDKQKLLDLDIAKDAEYPAQYLYKDLSLYDGKLYFIDNSNPKKHRLCRVNTNGKEVEEISSNSVTTYTIDAESNILYYSKASTAETTYYSNIYSVSLKNNSETKLAELSHSQNLTMEVLDGKLYMQPTDFIRKGLRENDATILSLFYDINTKELFGIFYSKDKEVFIEEYSGEYFQLED